MLNKKKYFIWLGIAVGCFITLLLLATFFDYQISAFLTKGGLVDGNYFSKNVIARFFEVFGVLIMYFIVSFALIILSVRFKSVHNKAVRIILICLTYILSCSAFLYGFREVFGYLHDFYPSSSFYSHYSDIWALLIYVAVGLGISFLYHNIIKKYDASLDKLVKFAIIVLFTAVVSMALVQGVKVIAARERFRTIYWFEQNNPGVDPGFKPWYSFEGSVKELATSLNVPKDYFKSFPSGHACASALIVVITAIPILFESQKKNFRYYVAIAILFTFIVAFERIVMGAHYLSDVTVGSFATIFCYFIALLTLKFKKETE